MVRELIHTFLEAPRYEPEIALRICTVDFGAYKGIEETGKESISEWRDARAPEVIKVSTAGDNMVKKGRLLLPPESQLRKPTNSK